MKINQIPDLYIEQYLLGELPENLRKEMDNLIQENSPLRDMINELKKSNREILSVYKAESIIPAIIETSKYKKNLSDEVTVFQMDTEKKKIPSIDKGPAGSLKNLIRSLHSVSTRRYALSFASAALVAIVLVFMIPGIRNSNNTDIPYDDTTRIKGLESKLILYRMKGNAIEELKNFDTAGKGEIIQAGYIAAGNYTHGVILSIDGRGAVTLHLTDSTAPEHKLVNNKKILLNKSYELDDSPYFERFILILSADPINTAEIIEKAKKLAKSRDSAMNGLIRKENEAEFSIILKKP